MRMKQIVAINYYDYVLYNRFDTNTNTIYMWLEVEKKNWYYYCWYCWGEKKKNKKNMWSTTIINHEKMKNKRQKQATL